MIEEELSTRLMDAGAVVVGFADLSPVDEATRQGFSMAVSFAMPLTPSIVAEIAQGPTEAYAAEYVRLNALLTQAAHDLAGFIASRRWKAQARPATCETLASWAVERPQLADCSDSTCDLSFAQIHPSIPPNPRLRRSFTPLANHETHTRLASRSSALQNS